MVYSLQLKRAQCIAQLVFIHYSLIFHFNYIFSFIVFWIFTCK